MLWFSRQRPRAAAGCEERPRARRIESVEYRPGAEDTGGMLEVKPFSQAEVGVIGETAEDGQIDIPR